MLIVLLALLSPTLGYNLKNALQRHCDDYTRHTEVEIRPSRLTRNSQCELPEQEPFGDIFDAATKNVKRTAVRQYENYHDYLLRGQLLDLIGYNGGTMEVVNGDRLRQSEESRFYAKYIDYYIEQPEALTGKQKSSPEPLTVKTMISNLSPRCHTGSGCSGDTFSGRDWNNRFYRIYQEGNFDCPETRPHIWMMQEVTFGINTVFNDVNGNNKDCSDSPSIEEWTFKDYDVLNIQKGRDSSLLAYDRTRFRLLDYWHTYSYVKGSDFEKMLEKGLPVEDYDIVLSTLCDSDCYPTKNMIIAVLQCRVTNRLIVAGSTHFSSSHLHDSRYGDAVKKHFGKILDEYRSIDPNIVMQLGGDFNSNTDSSSWDISMKGALEDLECHAEGANGRNIENLFYSLTGRVTNVTRFGAGTCDRSGHHMCQHACGNVEEEFDFNDPLGDCDAGDVMSSSKNPISDHPAVIVTLTYET